MKNSLMGFDSNFGEKLTIPYKPNVALPVSINMVMPTLFSRSSSHNDDIDRALNFFTKERGSIAISQAICSTHRVDLQSNSASKFTQPFIEAIKGMHYCHTIQPKSYYSSGLHLASKKSELIQNSEIKRFIDEFGTHYATSTVLGVKLHAERRYSFQERSSNSDEDLKKCNTANGVKIVGMQINPDLVKCNSPSLLDSNFTSREMQRYLVTTSGSYAISNITNWSSQIVEMYTEGILYPAPIKRKLAPILDLLQEESIKV